MRDFAERKHLLVDALCICMEPRIIVRLHVLHTRGCVYEHMGSVCPPSQCPRPVCLYSLIAANTALPPTPFLTVLSWMASSVTAYNRGCILCQTTPMWRIREVFVGTSERKKRELVTKWYIYIYLIVRIPTWLPDGISDMLVLFRKRAWKTIRVLPGRVCCIT